MRQFILIADSGGSKTDWALIKNDEVVYFSGPSCHPHFWSPKFWEKLSSFLKEKVDPQDCKLFFFGSGCLRKPNNEIAKNAFEKIGFETKVFSDLHAAAYALKGNDSGWCGIAGTGSVLFEWSGTEVKQIIGGKGHEVGDEGSGYFFGKLIFNAFNEGSLSMDQSILLMKNGLNERFRELNPLENKKEISEIPKMLSGEKELFKEFHTENIRQFIQKHIDLSAVSTISLSGSYVFFHQEEWKEIFSEFGVKIDLIIEKPISRLIEQRPYFID